MTGQLDVAAIDEWVRLHAEEDQALELKRSLPSLPDRHRLVLVTRLARAAPERRSPTAADLRLQRHPESR